ncbi:hypothetical protein INT47_009509, partial [Mucor saturninus]
MNITPSNIRSVVLQTLLLIFLAIVRTKADEIEEPLAEFQLVDFDFFNGANLDLVLVTPPEDAMDLFDGTETIHYNLLEPTSTTTTTTTTTTHTTTTHTTHTRSTKKTPTTTTTSTTTTTTSKAKSNKHSAAMALSEWTDPSTTEESTTSQESPSTSLSDNSSPSYIVPTMTLPLSILTSITSSTSTPSHSFINTTTPNNNNNNNNNVTTQYTNTSDPLVQYDLECRVNHEFCIKVSRAVGAAIDEFTRVVNVKINLLIKVTYYSFCEKMCANDTLGWGTPTSQFTLPFEDGADLNYVYPQALAKQLAPYSSTSVWAKYDIEIEINHDAYMNGIDIEQEMKDGWNGTGTPPNGKFWFINENITSSHPIQPHQVDFRYVVLHELLHGLGFLSSWAAYFWTDASPFRTLVDGIIDPLELQLVTPGPYWYINQDTGPTYVTGFQPTMIFDKYLVNVDTELNVTNTSPLSDLAFEMQDFCVQNNNAFILNFIKSFNAANQSRTAHKLWMSMSQPETVSFLFQPPTVADSSYNTIPYLNKTYKSMTLLTGADLFERSPDEQIDPTLNRPGLMISHLDEQYDATPDFLMTPAYHHGETLEDLVKQFYGKIPPIKYNVSTVNNTLVEQLYLSPIGPGILRILDSIGYSTVLTKTNYTTDGNVKTPKSRSVCDDSNTNHGHKPSPTATSTGNTLLYNDELIILIVLIASL